MADSGGWIRIRRAAEAEFAGLPLGFRHSSYLITITMIIIIIPAAARLLCSACRLDAPIVWSRSKVLILTQRVRKTIEEVRVRVRERSSKISEINCGKSMSVVKSGSGANYRNNSQHDDWMIHQRALNSSQRLNLIDTRLELETGWRPTINLSRFVSLFVLSLPRSLSSSNRSHCYLFVSY